MGLVGESGSGKTTLAYSLLQFIEAEKGEILFYGKNLQRMSKRQIQVSRSKFQMIFQNPGMSLNPMLNIQSCLSETISVVHPENVKNINHQVISLLERVGLNEKFLIKYPRQLSGGEMQRIAIARALAAAPKLIIADEPTASLDEQLRRQILDLLKKLQIEEEMTLLLISHDLQSVAHLTDRIAVLYRGRLVENGATAKILNTPLHPYTQMLITNNEIIENGPWIDGLQRVQHDGCAYVDSCPIRIKDCFTAIPELRESHSGMVACFVTGGSN